MRQLEGNVGIEIRGRDAIERVDIRRAGALGIFPGKNILAEMIQAHRHSGSVAVSRGFDGESDVLSRNKPLRPAASGAVGSDPATKAGAFCEFEKQRA